MWLALVILIIGSFIGHIIFDIALIMFIVAIIGYLAQEFVVEENSVVTIPSDKNNWGSARQQVGKVRRGAQRARRAFRG